LLVVAIVHRMIFRELLKVFVLSLVGITGILLLAGIIAEATQQGLSPGQILIIIPLLIPSTLPYTIPATTLFAVCTVYGRLAADNEILALKSAGVNVLTVIKPGLLLGVLMSGLTLGLYYHTIPHTHHLLRTLFLNDVEEMLYTMLRKQGQICYPQLQYAMYVKGVEGRKLIGPIFKRRDERYNVDLVAEAREADLRVDLPRQVVMIHMRYCVASSESGPQAFFDDKIWEVPLPDSLNNDANRRPRAM